MKVSRDAMKKGLVKDKPFARQQEDMRYARSQAKTNAERKAIDQVMRRMESDPMVQKTMQRETVNVNPKYATEIDRNMTKEINRAIDRGELKRDKKGYAEFMDKTHGKGKW